MGLEGYAEAIYPLHHYGWSDLRAIRSGRYKLIDAPRPELYDLERDPREEHNLFTERRALGERMVARLREQENAFEKVQSEQPAEDVDPEVRARLAALGYVGSFVASTSEARTDRADPKDKIGLFNLMSHARDSSQGEDSLDQSIALLQQVIKEDPNVIDAWVMLGNQHQRLQKYREAVGFYRRALELKPDYDLAVINLAGAYRALGDENAALAGYERYLELNPKDAYVRYSMGELYLDRGDLAGAEQEFQQALAANNSVAPAKNALGVIAYQRGDLESAERLTREALAMKSDVRLARYNLALIAEERGDLPTAEREYLEELKLHPDSYKAAFNLSRLYERTGERQLQIDALKQSIDGNPQFAVGHFFLAKAYLDAGGHLDDAAKMARKGLELEPRSEMAPLGHYVLADVYNRQGRAAEAAREFARGKALEASQRTAKAGE
jgi:tetratricopeptide (TPR) repeat protein